jgi:hypothetical protein
VALNGVIKERRARGFCNGVLKGLLLIVVLIAVAPCQKGKGAVSEARLDVLMVKPRPRSPRSPLASLLPPNALFGGSSN